MAAEGVYASADWQAFVAAIRASQADDLPRLAAADWLDDRGEADRAEFIRLQVQLAPLEQPHPTLPAPTGTRYMRCDNCRAYRERDNWTVRCRGLGCRLRRRESKLLGRYRNAWTAAAFAEPMTTHERVVVQHVRHDATGAGGILAGWARWTWGWLFQPNLATFDRGFLSTARLPLRMWSWFADGLLRREPVANVELPAMPSVDVSTHPPYHPARWSVRLVPHAITQPPGLTKITFPWVDVYEQTLLELAQAAGRRAVFVDDYVLRQFAGSLAVGGFFAANWPGVGVSVPAGDARIYQGGSSA